MALNFLNRGQPLVGLDIGSSAIKAVELRSLRGGRYELVSLGIQELSPGCVAHGAILSKLPVSDAINRIFAEHSIKNKRVATSVSGHSVIVKKISLPAPSDEGLVESIHWEAGQHIPFDIADVSLDYQILEESTGTGSLELLLVAVKKEKIADQTGVITMAGKNPVVVDVDAFALQNAYEINYTPVARATSALLDIGASITTINIVSGTDLLFTRGVAVGGHLYTDFIRKEFDLGFSQSQALKHGQPVEGIEPWQTRRVIDSVTEIICLEIHKTFDFFKTTTASERIDRMLVSGGASHTPGLIETLGRRFEIPAEKFDSLRNISRDSKRFSSSMLTQRAPDLAVAVGLALRKAVE
jgi:type IV pilus assembly protein PilM